LREDDRRELDTDRRARTRACEREIAARFSQTFDQSLSGVLEEQDPRTMLGDAHRRREFLLRPPIDEDVTHSRRFDDDLGLVPKWAFWSLANDIELGRARSKQDGKERLEIS
jgi:hypothetical protein